MCYFHQHVGEQLKSGEGIEITDFPKSWNPEEHAEEHFAQHLQ